MKPKWSPSQFQRYRNLVKNIENWADFLKLKLMGSWKEKHFFFTSQKVRVEVPSVMLHTFKEVFMDDTYFRGFDEVKLEEPVIFDIGANVGYFSLFAASQFPKARVFAFEPIPNNFELLRSQCEQNKHVSIIPSRKAVSDQNGSVTMSYDSAEDFSVIASIFSANHPSCVNSIDVDCIDLETACADNGLDRIDFLKMDCEGAEHGILRACPEQLLKSVKYIAMEVHSGHSQGEDENSLCAFLRGKGFDVVIATNPKGEHPLVWAHRK